MKRSSWSPQDMFEWAKAIGLTVAGFFAYLLFALTIGPAIWKWAAPIVATPIGALTILDLAKLLGIFLLALLCLVMPPIGIVAYLKEAWEIIGFKRRMRERIPPRKSE